MTGKHIQDLMKQEGYSVNEMAKMIGTSQPNLLSALKHDDIRTGLLEDIAKAMGKPLSFFYGEAYGNVQTSGDNSTSVQVGGNATNVATSADDRLLTLLVNKDEQLTMSMKQTEKAMDQTTRAMEQAFKSQGQIDDLIKMINR